MSQSTMLLSELSAEAFASLGVNQVAYVRPVEENGVGVFAVHAADGTRLSVLPEVAVAFAAIVQNDMQPLSLH